MQFKACLTKDFIELFKTKRWYFLLSGSIGCAFLSALIILIFKLLQSSGVDVSSFTGGDAQLASLFSVTYMSSFMFFSVYLSTYFTIVMIVLFGKTISKEIKEKKWVMPLSCGIKAENLVLSKIIVNFVGLIAVLLAGGIINIIFSVCLCESGGISVGTLILYTILLIVFIIFMYFFTICLNAITKSAKIAIGVSIALLILAPEVLNMFKISNIPFVNFTPFLFLNLSMSGSMLNSVSAIEYIISSIVTIAMIVILIILSISFNKIKVIEK